MVQMILARRPGEAGLRDAVSGGNCGFDLFNSFPIKAWILRLTGPIQTIRDGEDCYSILNRQLQAVLEQDTHRQTSTKAKTRV
jgi:hypothetical protein